MAQCIKNPTAVGLVLQRCGFAPRHSRLKDPALPHLWLGSAAQIQFLPKNFHMPQVQPQKEKKKSVPQRCIAFEYGFSFKKEIEINTQKIHVSINV